MRDNAAEASRRAQFLRIVDSALADAALMVQFDFRINSFVLPAFGTGSDGNGRPAESSSVHCSTKRMISGDASNAYTCQGLGISWPHWAGNVSNIVSVLHQLAPRSRNTRRGVAQLRWPCMPKMFGALGCAWHAPPRARSYRYARRATRHRDRRTAGGLPKSSEQAPNPTGVANQSLQLNCTRYIVRTPAWAGAHSNPTCNDTHSTQL